jgi:dihydrofolate reductase
MRTLTVTTFVSLDGVMEAPGGEPGYPHAGWVGPYFDAQLGAYKLAEQLAAEVLLLGKRTYDSFAAAWPTRDDEMADKINGMTKHVVSGTLGSSDWHDTHVIGYDDVRGLKEQEGGPVLVAGSRSLVHALLRDGLVDELHLQVFPVVLGSGLRVYPEQPERVDLELRRTETTGNGVLLQEYRVLS